MSQPKRHHWWPIAQSKYWTDADGLVTVTRADGTSFRPNPLNIGVESELYTRFLEDDSKDTAIEEWFADVIDGPATAMINHLLDPLNVTKREFRGDPIKAKTVKAVGFRVNSYVEEIKIPPHVRVAISQYIAALLVRHPRYLSRLIRFHQANGFSEKRLKNLALDNMLQLYGKYAERISTSVFLVTRRIGSAEYLYSDGGLLVEEPWRAEGGIPFDIHAPLTPDIALQVLPYPLGLNRDLTIASITESTNQGVARQNRIVLGGASRFVFSRQAISPSFITQNFGKPAPKNIGHRLVNGRLEAWFDPTRT